MSNISNNSGDIPDEVDIIIAGGGAAGCVVAARLAAAAPELSILIIEGGINNKDVATVIYPALYLANLAPTSKTALFYKSNPRESLNGREAIVPAGGCLGGGSSINFMMYTRGQAIDYDSWRTEGWAAKDLIPLFQKTEKFHPKDPRIDKSVHGYSGKLNVSDGTFQPREFEDDWLQAAAQVGLKEVADVNNLVEADGIQRCYRWVDPNTGRRQDAAHTLIHPLLEQNSTGLRVLTEHKVVKVLVEDGKAVGVEYYPNLAETIITPASSAAAHAKTVRARKLVVVSAGALSSPQILERSGIGRRDLLEKLSIPIVSEIDGVGENYQDHNLLIYAYTSNGSEEQSFDPILDGRFDVPTGINSLSDPCSEPQSRRLGWNAVDLGAKLRISAIDASKESESFRALWEKDYANSPTRPLMLFAAGNGFLGDHALVPQGQYFSTACYTAYPYSRGHVHISSTDANAAPDFDAGFLNHEFDLDALVWAYKRQREIVRRTKHFAGGDGVIIGPKFPQGGKAINWDWPTENGAVTPYTEEDEEAIRQFVKNEVATTWHSCGTLAMRPKEEMGVVDGRLNVYGVERLKVADLSILPENVAANTYSTALVVGEKAACIIAEELGIEGF